MDRSDLIPIAGQDGWRGGMEPQQVQHDAAPHVVVHIENERVLVPTNLLQRRQDGSYFLPVSRAELLQASSPASRGNDEVVVPVVAEEVDVQKRRWDTGGVRVHMAVHEREEVVDEPLRREEVRIERVPINQVVDQPPAPRQDGATMIIPVLEEVLVVEKRLMLKEEVRITRRQFEAHEPQKVILRSEEPQIERIPSQPPGSAERNAA